jgi:hypothetical protein
MPREVPVFLDHDRADLLDDLMTALNALTAAGCPVTVKDGCLDCRAGKIMPASRGRWASRPLVGSFGSRPWPPPDGLLGELRDEDGCW